VSPGDEEEGGDRAGVEWVAEAVAMASSQYQVVD
jgi:hypothetical protein